MIELYLYTDLYLYLQSDRQIGGVDERNVARITPARPPTTHAIMRLYRRTCGNLLNTFRACTDQPASIVSTELVATYPKAKSALVRLYV